MVSPGPGTSSSETFFRLVDGIVRLHASVAVGRFMLSVTANRRSDGVGEGEGVGDNVRNGVGGLDVAEWVHVREHTVQVVDEQLGTE